MLKPFMGSLRLPLLSSSPASSFSRTARLPARRWPLPPPGPSFSDCGASVSRQEISAPRLSFRCIQRTSFFRFASKTSPWSAEQSPYDVLGVDWTVDEDGIKAAYRKMAKLYHPDVYDGSVELEEGETPETRFIKVQAAYELLVDKDERQQYDHDNQVNPLKASKAWMEWISKKKKAFEQRGDMAVSAWAEQQQRELNLKARRLAKHKMDPEEERRILTREKQASAIQLESTLRRHTLVLKKRDLIRRKMDESAKKNS